MRKQLQEHIARLRAAGALYVDARWYPVEENNDLMMWNGNLKDASASRESGVGVRVLYKGAWGFSAASDLSNLGALFDKAFDNARVAAERVTFPVRLAEKDTIQASFTSPNRIDPFTVPLSDKLAFMQAMDAKLNQPGVFQRICQLTFTRKQIVFMDRKAARSRKRSLRSSLHPGGRSDAQADALRTTAHRVWATRAGGKARYGRSTPTPNASCANERSSRGRRRVRSVILPGILFLSTRPSGTRSNWIASSATSWPSREVRRPVERFGTLRYGSVLTARADATVPNSPAASATTTTHSGAEQSAIDRACSSGDHRAADGREANARASHLRGQQRRERATAFYQNIERMTNINIDPGDDGTLDDIVRNTSAAHHPGRRQELVHRLQPRAVPLRHRHRLAGGGWASRASSKLTTRARRCPTIRCGGGDITWEVHYTPNCGKGQPNQIMQLGHGIPVCRFDNVRIGE